MGNQELGLLGAYLPKGILYIRLCAVLTRIPMRRRYNSIRLNIKDKMQ